VLQGLKRIVWHEWLPGLRPRYLTEG